MKRTFMGGPRGQNIEVSKAKGSLDKDNIKKLREDIERIYGVGMAEVALNYIFDPRVLPGDEQLYQFNIKEKNDSDRDMPNL